MESWSSALTTAFLLCRYLISATRCRYSTAVRATAPTKAGAVRLPRKVSRPVSSRFLRPRSTKPPIRYICPLHFLTSLPSSTLRCVTPLLRRDVQASHKFRLELSDLRLCLIPKRRRSMWRTFPRPQYRSSMEPLATPWTTRAATKNLLFLQPESIRHRLVTIQPHKRSTFPARTQTPPGYSTALNATRPGPRAARRTRPLRLLERVHQG